MKLNHFIKVCLLGLSLVLSNIVAAAANSSPVGYWQTMQEGSNQPNSIVRITENNNTLQGKVVKLYTNPDAVCDQCAGDMHNQPVMGATVLWGFSQLQNGGWSEGNILAIKRGKVFPASLALSGDGQTLEVNVKAGFGNHAQTWQRVSGPNG